MRVIGLGWSEFATRWSSNKDSKIGTVTHLRALLIEILEHEITARRMKELPDEAALPQQVSRDLGQLGAVLTELSQEQADYIGVAKGGPYKPGTYRY